MQLQEHREAFAAAGIDIVALTYDAPEAQHRFIEKHSITYPVLSDVNAESVRALGILNADYQPGDTAYGIPYPGIFVVAPDQRIVGRVFLDGYETRVDAAAVLDFARQKLDPAGASSD